MEKGRTPVKCKPSALASNDNDAPTITLVPVNSGEPFTSVVPPKKKRKGKDANAAIPTDTPVLPSTPAPFSPLSVNYTLPSSQWKSFPVQLRTQMETQLHTLHDQLHSFIASESLLQPPVDLPDVRNDITNLQKRVSDLSTIVTGRFLEHHNAILGLSTPAGSLSLEHCLPDLRRHARFFSMGTISELERLAASPSAIVVTFRTEQNAKDFMSAARALSDRFYHFTPCLESRRMTAWFVPMRWDAGRKLKLQGDPYHSGHD
ncbi:hypothetical protein DFS33DRAFT_1385662 [Desarmillaria ectypa]|nr:hypothetical protein DFS33DRAFT_1385662 [Desarmillaria ectypa]